MIRMLYFIRQLYKPSSRRKILYVNINFYVMVKRKNFQPPSWLIVCFKITRYREKSVV